MPEPDPRHRARIPRTQIGLVPRPGRQVNLLEQRKPANELARLLVRFIPSGATRAPRRRIIRVERSFLLGSAARGQGKEESRYGAAHRGRVSRFCIFYLNNAV